MACTRFVALCAVVVVLGGCSGAEEPAAAAPEPVAEAAKTPSTEPAPEAAQAGGGGTLTTVPKGTWELRADDETNDFLGLAHRTEEGGDLAVLWESGVESAERSFRLDPAVVDLKALSGGCAAHTDFCGALQQLVPSVSCQCIAKDGTATPIEPAAEPSDAAFNLAADTKATNIDDGTYALKWGVNGSIWAYLYRSTKSQVELTVAYDAAAGLDLARPFALPNAGDVIEHERLADADGVEDVCAGELKTRCDDLVEQLRVQHRNLQQTPTCSWSRSRTKAQSAASVKGCPTGSATATNYTPSVYQMVDGAGIRGHYLVNPLGGGSAGQELCSIDLGQSCTIHIDRGETLRFIQPAEWDTTKGRSFDCGAKEGKPTHPESFFEEGRDQNPGAPELDRWVSFATYDTCAAALSHVWP